MAGGRCPARRASLSAVPARAWARTWDRRAGQTCAPAQGLSRAGCRFRARTPVRTGRLPMGGQRLDRRGEPGGRRWRGHQARGRAGRKAERKARDPWLARADGQGQVPCADRPRDLNHSGDQNQPRDRDRPGGRSRDAGRRPLRGARLRLRCRSDPPGGRKGLPHRGTGPRPGCGLEWADRSLANPDSSRRRGGRAGPATNPGSCPGATDHGRAADHGPAMDHRPGAGHRGPGYLRGLVPSNGPLPDADPQDADLRGADLRHDAARSDFRSGGPHAPRRDRGPGRGRDRAHGPSRGRGHQR